jgi:hypothetical protein
MKRFTSEKNTDQIMLNLWFKSFGFNYNTSSNKRLFKDKIPNGWFIDNKTLFIIENKRSLSMSLSGVEQLQKYYNLINKDDFTKIYLILGLGSTEKEFKYTVYIPKNNKLEIIEETLDSLANKMKIRKKFDETIIHEFNQFIYDKNINLVKSEKTLFVSFILICLKINPEFINEFN